MLSRLPNDNYHNYGQSLSSALIVRGSSQAVFFIYCMVSGLSQWRLTGKQKIIIPLYQL